MNLAVIMLTLAIQVQAFSQTEGKKTMYRVNENWDVRQILDDLAGNKLILDQLVTVYFFGGVHTGKVFQRTPQFIVLKEAVVNKQGMSSRHADKKLADLAIIPLSQITAIKFIAEEP